MDHNKKLIFKKKKKAEPIFSSVWSGSQPYALPPPHLDPCPRHHWSGGRVSVAAVVEEPPSSRSRCRHHCHCGGANAAGRDEQEVEDHARLYALASMRAPPLGEGAPGSGPALSWSRRNIIGVTVLLCRPRGGHIPPRRGPGACCSPPCTRSLPCTWSLSCVRERGRMVKNVCCRTIEREQDIRMSRREEHEIFLLRSGRAFSTSLLKRMEENALSVCA
jgi:hypothetical protein